MIYSCFARIPCIFSNSKIIAYGQYAVESYGEITTEYIKMLSGHKSCIANWAEITEQLKIVRATPTIVASSQAIQAYSQQANQIADDSPVTNERL